MLPPGSQHPNFMLTARFKTTAAAGTIVGKPFAHGLWRNGGSAGQGKMFFLRGGHVGFDIGWVGYFGCPKAVNDGLWHETALRYVAGESTQYQLFVDDMSTPCSKGFFPTADHPDTSIVIGKAIGHAYGDMSDWANGDMAPAFSGEIVDVSYVALGADGSPLATTPAPTAPVPAPAPAIEMTEAEAKEQCGKLCLESNFCCNNPDIGSNQFFSCSQACMVRYYGASEQECLNLVNTQTQERGCSRNYGAHSSSFCSKCADLTDQCPWGVQSGDASQKGCTMDVKTNQTEEATGGDTGPKYPVEGVYKLYTTEAAPDGKDHHPYKLVHVKVGCGLMAYGPLGSDTGPERFTIKKWGTNDPDGNPQYKIYTTGTAPDGQDHCPNKLVHVKIGGDLMAYGDVENNPGTGPEKFTILNWGTNDPDGRPQYKIYTTGTAPDGQDHCPNKLVHVKIG